MDNGSNSEVTSGLVYIGALVIFGIPGIVLSFNGLLLLLSVIGLDDIASSSVGTPVIILLSLLVGLQLAVEATAVQIRGFEALKRGSASSVLIRYITLLSAVFLTLIVITWLGSYLVIGESGLITILVPALTTIAMTLFVFNKL